MRNNEWLVFGLVALCLGMVRHALRVAHRAASIKRFSEPEPSVQKEALPARRLIRRGNRVESDLLEALAMIGRSVHSGSSLSVAIASAAMRCAPGRVGSGLRQVDSDAKRIGMIGALRAWGESDSLCTRTAWALSIAAETGGDPLAAVDALTASLRSEGALTRELGALTAQSTLSAAVLAIVPLGFGGLLSGTDPQARHFLFFSSAGRVCLVVGLALDLLAWRWLRRIGRVSV
jgi:tight adherence protein B